MPIDAVIFDWGGTLTRWHDVDFHAESLALARAVVAAGEPDPAAHAALLHRAGDTNHMPGRTARAGGNRVR